MTELPDDYICEGQMSIWDYIPKEEPIPIKDWSQYMNKPKGECNGDS